MSGGQTVESRALRVAVADDAVLLREGIGQILRAGGMEVVASVDTAEELLRAVAADGDVDAIVLDIKMPPTHTDEGLRALERLRASGSRAGILLLSMYTTASYAIRAMSAGSGTGYLLKDRVADVGDFVDALVRVADGQTVLDPEVVRQLLGATGGRDAGLERLTAREREVLELMAQGRSNGAIADALYLSYGAVEKNVAAIFSKLDLEPDTADHRRVLAVLRYLGA